MKPRDESVIDAKLSIQRALLGNVPPDLRAVAFSVDDKTLEIRCYFDGPIKEKDQESMSLMETEVMSDYEPDFGVTMRCIRIDHPFGIPDDGIWVFERRE